MCGIIGEFGEELIQKDIFIDLSNKSVRRGPDMSGYWTNNKNIQLGFNRLSILDTSKNGNQPMISKDYNWVISINGEIFNYREIKNQLGYPSSYYVSDTDTEVILNAFASWGVKKTLNKINGIFAIALYNIKKNEIYLIRDFAGVKPLYYGMKNNHLIFASQYDQVFHHPYFKKELIPNQFSFTDYIRLGYIPAPNAFFKDTWQVEPGEIIVVKQNLEIFKERYYLYPKPTSQYIETEQNTLSELDYTFSNVIDRQLLSDVPIGAFLSGGIDSPLICSYINNKVNKLDTFTIGSNDSEYDESNTASDYSRFLNTQNHLYMYSEADLIKDIDDHFKAYSEPFGDYSSLLSYQVCKNARTRFTVAFGGDGGDEIFWGYPRFLRFIKHRHWFKMNQTLRTILSSSLRYFGNKVSYGVSGESIQSWALGHHSHNNIEILKKILPNQSNSIELKNLYDGENDLNNIEEILFWLRKNEFYGHLQRILLKMDRASMYHGLEVRVPFLDKEMLEFSSKIQPELGFKHEIPKYLLKELIIKRFPKEMVEFRKRGFSFNLDKSLKTILKDEVLSLLVDSDPYPYNTFDRNELNKLVHSYYNGEYNNPWSIWVLYSLQKWAFTFNIV